MFFSCTNNGSEELMIIGTMKQTSEPHYYIIHFQILDLFLA